MSAAQLDIFGTEHPIQQPRRRRMQPTQIAASADPDHQARALILTFMWRRRPEAVTVGEIAQELGLSGAFVQDRRRELEQKGLIYKAGVKEACGRRDWAWAASKPREEGTC